MHDYINFHVWQLSYLPFNCMGLFAGWHKYYSLHPIITKTLCFSMFMIVDTKNNSMHLIKHNFTMWKILGATVKFRKLIKFSQVCKSLEIDLKLSDLHESLSCLKSLNRDQFDLIANIPFTNEIVISQFLNLLQETSIFNLHLMLESFWDGKVQKIGWYGKYFTFTYDSCFHFSFTHIQLELHLIIFS